MAQCEKHDETMSRLFENEKNIEIKLENIDTKMDSMIEFKNTVHEIIFGNGKPGLKGKLETLGAHINKLWGFMMLLMTAIITASAVVIFSK